MSGIEMAATLIQSLNVDAVHVKQHDIQSMHNPIFAVKFFANILWKTDKHTLSHCKRVADLSFLISHHLRLDDSERSLIYVAAFFHDIGKIGIPDRILKKRGPFNETEYIIMQSHSVIGRNLLSFIPEFEEVREAVLHHHEKIDGSGYPDRLKGNEIPLASRIITVADSFDAMLSRAYSKHQSITSILNELKRHAGSQFDAEIVGILNRNIQHVPYSAIKKIH